MSRMEFPSGRITARGLARHIGAGALLLALAACGGRQDAGRASVEYKGTNPEAGSPADVSPQAAAPTAPAGPGGIVSYQGYQAAVARDGDTVASVASRIGLSASELAAYNGLTPDHQLRPGDELVLPPRPGGYGGTGQPAETQTQLAQAEPPGGTGGNDYYGGSGYGGTSPGGAGYGGTGTSSGGIEAAPLESAPAAQTGESSDNWSPDLAAAAIDRWHGFDAEGNIAAPPSTSKPLPPDPEPAPELASPQLDQYQTGASVGTPSPEPRPTETISTPAEEPVEAAPEPAATPPTEAEQTQMAAATPSGASLRLIRPAEGPIVVGYQQGGGRTRNDGVDFASPAGSPVVAAAAGEVALVSQSLGGLGTIVLVRHPGDYLTVYGRIDRVNVGKGDIVSQGQKIGVVASNSTPRMHFEVRKGAESLNPERFF